MRGIARRHLASAEIARRLRPALNAGVSAAGPGRAAPRPHGEPGFDPPAFAGRDRPGAPLGAARRVLWRAAREARLALLTFDRPPAASAAPSHGADTARREIGEGRALIAPFLAKPSRRSTRLPAGSSTWIGGNRPKLTFIGWKERARVVCRRRDGRR